jgi:predicted lysophospholipase L1 biosynthesis ABC-type transport system permease subunit
VSGSDTRETPLVAVVSASFARRHWPGQAAAGRRFTIALAERTVVGVVGDVRVRGLEGTSEPQVYLPSAQMADSALINYPPKDLVVRSAGAGAALAPAVRRIVAAVDPEQPVSDVRTLSEVVEDETASRVTQVRLLGVMSAIALLIAAVGIHGLLTFTVTQRTQEIGIRRALGEQTASVLGRVFREGLALTLAGIAIGVWLAYLAAQAMRALLADVGPGDPATILLAASLCLATAVIGCLRPALWASRVDPLSALRQD